MNHVGILLPFNILVISGAEKQAEFNSLFPAIRRLLSFSEERKM